MKERLGYRIKLKIADVVILIKSRSKGELYTKDNIRSFSNFIYQGSKNPDIVLEVKPVNKLPSVKGKKRLFVVIHPDSNEINWAMYKNNSDFILRTYSQSKKQYIKLNAHFNKGEVFGIIKNDSGLTWRLMDIVYDALHIILVKYLNDKDGLFIHAFGCKDLEDKGLIFIGHSGAGKSTLARLWHEHTKSMILNDDRIIIRKKDRSFLMYGSPWHGDFSDYMVSRMDSAVIKNLIFVKHDKRNSLKTIGSISAFNLLYPNVFPVFWDRSNVGKALFMCEQLVSSLQCYSLGFKNNKDIIKFIRKEVS